MASRSQRRKLGEPAEVPAPIVQAPLPPELIQIILQYLYPQHYFRLSIASSAWKSLTIPNISKLSLFPFVYAPRIASMERFLRWTNDLSPKTLQLSKLTSLEVRTIGPHMDRLVRHAPILQKLSVSFDGAYSDYLDQFCTAVRECVTISHLMVTQWRAKVCDLGQLLPPQLSELSLLAHIESVISENDMASVARAAPNLVSIIYSRAPLSSFGPIKGLTKLRSISVLVTHLGDTLKTTEEWEAMVTAVAAVLPEPTRKWKRLHLNGFSLPMLVASQYQNLPLVRRALAMGLEMNGTNFSIISHHNFQEDTDEGQLAFCKFLVEECQVKVKPCLCLQAASCARCARCFWMKFIPALQPQTSAYVIERWFLPFLAAKSARTGLDQGTAASLCLANFQQNQREATVLNYLRNYDFPLDVSYVPERGAAMFYNLGSVEARKALIARATATNADLGLSLAAASARTPVNVLIEAACVDSRAFLLNLWRLLSCETEFLYERAAACTLTLEDKLKYLADPSSRVSMIHIDSIALAVLEVLLPEKDISELITKAVVDFQTPDFKWLAQRGFKFSGYRTATGKNWLHIYLTPLLAAVDLGSFPFDPALLAEADTDGNTPLHLLCSNWRKLNTMTACLTKLKPHFEYIESKGIWDQRNKQGLRPFDLITKAWDRRRDNKMHFNDPNLTKLASRYVPQ